MTVKVLVDSTSYIPEDLIDAYSIARVSLYINDGESHERELDMDYQAFYRRLEDMQQLPKSAQPAQGEIIEQITAILKAGDDVCCVLLSSKMSGTVDTVEMLAEQIQPDYPERKIVVVDAQSNSMQVGYAALAAARVALDGGNIGACESAARETMRKTRYLFSPHTLEYLERGGRIGKATALLGSLLKLVPVLTVESGETTTYTKVRSLPKALMAIRDKMAEDSKNYGGIAQAVVHSIAQSDQAEAFARNLIEPIAGFPVDVIALGPVIGAHVGPAVGVVYETNRPLRP